MGVCLRVLKESNKSRFDSYSVRKSVLIISHITFRDCRVHSFSDNLSRNSCILKYIMQSMRRALGPAKSADARVARKCFELPRVFTTEFSLSPKASLLHAAPCVSGEVVRASFQGLDKLGQVRLLVSLWADLWDLLWRAVNPSSLRLSRKSDKKKKWQSISRIYRSLQQL